MKLIRNSKIAILSAVIAISACFPFGAIAADTSDYDAIEKKRQELKEIEMEMSQLQSSIDDRTEENFSLEGYVEKLNSEIEKLRLEISKSETEIAITEEEIDKKQESLEELNSDLGRKKRALKSYLRHMSRENTTSAFVLFLSNSKLSKFFRMFNYARSVERKVYESAMEVKEVRDDIDEEKQDLESKSMEIRATASTLFEQQREADYKKQESEALHGRNASEIQSLEDVSQSTAELRDQTRNQLFMLESAGKSVKFTDAVDAAVFAEKKTGVEAPLLLGIMSQESGLGRNVGQCGYEGNMNPDQYGVFRDIMRDLNKTPESVKVSCKPSSYQGWGGAIGPAQFIPSTWVGYKDRVSAATGRPADPWEMTDAMIAIGLYISAHGGGVMDSQATRAAVGQFFAGANWQNYPWYVEGVYSKANVFKEQMGRL